jgi:hypothetical protein
MTRLTDICFGPQQGLLPPDSAVGDCAQEGLSLPTPSQAFRIDEAVPENVRLWSSVIYYDDPTETILGVSASRLVFNWADAGPRNYRCVSTPTR